MPLALNLNVQVKDGTLVVTDCAGKTVTFSKAQTVQQKVSMITLGELSTSPNIRSPPASASSRAPPTTTAATRFSRGPRPTSCPNGRGHTYLFNKTGLKVHALAGCHEGG